MDAVNGKMRNMDSLGNQAWIKLESVDEEGLALKLLFLVEKREVLHLQVDFCLLDDVSGRTLGGLLLVHRTLREKGGNLRLSNVSPFVHELIWLTGLTRVLDVRERHRSTVASLR